MAGALLTVEIDDKGLSELLNTLLTRTQNMKPVFEIVGKILRDSVRENFLAGGRPEKWTPLKDATLLNTIRRGENMKVHLKQKGGLKKKAVNRLADKRILIESKHLMNSINYKASKDKVEIGTNVVYGATHQFGRDAIKGIFAYENSSAADEITKADIGKDCYIVDDQSVAKTDGTGTRSVAGKVFDVNSHGVWVKF